MDTKRTKIKPDEGISWAKVPVAPIKAWQKNKKGDNSELGGMCQVDTLPSLLKLLSDYKMIKNLMLYYHLLLTLTRKFHNKKQSN